jgi:hypothetical protein
MFGNIGHNAYWILMGINMLGVTAVVCFWPETKGVSLEHMDQIFGEVNKVEAFKSEHHVDFVGDVHRAIDETRAEVEHGE